MCSQHGRSQHSCFSPARTSPSIMQHHLLCTSLWRNNQLTAVCVSAILEHLLDGDELVAKHEEPVDDTTPRTTQPESEPRHEQPGDRPLSASVAPTASQPDPDKKAMAATVRQEGEDSPSPSSGSTPAPSPSSSSSRPQSPGRSSSSPVIFLGFGSGANSLLHLAAGALGAPAHPGKRGQGERFDGSAGDDDGGGYEHDEGGGGGNEGEYVSDSCGGAGSAGGPLSSALRRRGLRVGGMVLVNGFVSLDEQSRQARRRCDAGTLGLSYSFESGSGC